MGDELRETHTSTLLLLGDHVYKRKKALDLGFSDFRQLASRRQACEDEVRLNRRTSPDVYEGVATVLGPDGAPCEALVVMRRLPSDRSLDALVERGEDVRGPLLELAQQLARLHRDNPLPAARQGLLSAEQLHRLWADATAVLAVTPTAPDQLVGQLDRLGHDWLSEHAALLMERSSSRRGVDGHGDLLTDDVFVLEDGPRLLDCLEFDADLRAVDGLHDACSLAMDLMCLGAAEDAWFFLDRYQELMGDPAPRSLAHFYIAYRALVRAKVAGVRAQQGDGEAATRLLLLAALCRSQLHQAAGQVVLIGGLPGTGKSTLSAVLAETLGCQRISSDEVRRAAQRGGTPDYGEEARSAVYSRLLEQASHALSVGQDVILDATFARSRWREDARRLAQQHHARITELHCTVSSSVARQRLLARGPGSSDADPAVHRLLAEHWETWPQATVVDCTDLSRATKQVELMLDDSGTALSPA